MTNLRCIEPIGEYIIPTCDGSEAKVVSHALSSGAYVSLLCDAPFMLTLETALALGKQLVKLAIQARRSAMERDQEAGKPSDLIEAELVEEGGGEWCGAIKEVGNGM